MAIKIKASAQAVKEAEEGSDLVNPPKGYYVAELTKCEAGTSKAGNPQILCVYKITGIGREDTKPTSEERYWPQKDYVQLEGDTTEWKRAEFLLAMGKPTKGRSSAMDIENEPNRPGTVIGTRVLIRLEDDSYEDKQTGKKVQTVRLAKVLPFSVKGENHGASDDELDAVDEGEIPAYDPVDNTITTTDGEVTEYTPWTREGLVAATKTDLKETATEFGVNIISGMTKGNVVDAILEAQTKWMEEQTTGAVQSSAGDEVGGEDEPF